IHVTLGTLSLIPFPFPSFNHQIFDTKTVAVGQNVTLNCSRDHLWHLTNLFWIRLVSQTFPEILGSTISHNVEIIEKINHITTKQEPGAFVLHMNRAQLNDTAVYYCIKVTDTTCFIYFYFIGPETGISSVAQDFLSDLLHQGDPVTLQCSVLSNSENKTCTEAHSVYWYRAKPDDTHASLIYAHGTSGYNCEQSPEAPSQQKCVYSFSKNISSSDTGVYYCAVATCGEIFFGNGTKLDVEGSTFQNIFHFNYLYVNVIYFPLLQDDSRLNIIYFNLCNFFHMVTWIQYTYFSAVCCHGYKSDCYSHPYCCN
uniref:Ig-like domain-containing protein n=1 Tax=Amphilophus citrinellus TaxID=61819 RepID=A0A3Q0SHL6_AMPCI